MHERSLNDLSTTGIASGWANAIVYIWEEIFTDSIQYTRYCALGTSQHFLI